MKKILLLLLMSILIYSANAHNHNIIYSNSSKSNAKNNNYYSKRCNKALPVPYSNVTLSDLHSQMEKDGIANTLANQLKGKYVYKVVINAGGGYATQTEMQMCLNGITPVSCLAKGVSDDSDSTRTRIGVDSTSNENGTFLNLFDFNNKGWVNASNYTKAPKLFMELNSKWGSDIDTYIYLYIGTDQLLDSLGYALLDNYDDDFGSITIKGYKIQNNGSCTALPFKDDFSGNNFDNWTLYKYSTGLHGSVPKPYLNNGRLFITTRDQQSTCFTTGCDEWSNYSIEVDAKVEKSLDDGYNGIRVYFDLHNISETNGISFDGYALDFDGREGIWTFYRTFSDGTPGESLAKGNKSINVGTEYHIKIVPKTKSFDIYINEKGKTETLLASVPRSSKNDLTGGKVAFGGADDLISIDNVNIQNTNNLYQNGTFEFISKAKAFVSPTFYTNAKSYFYYYINANDKTPPKGTTFSFNLKEENNTIPAGATYLGNGILKFWLKIDKNSNLSNIQISIPDTISNNGNEIILKNIPSPFTIPVQNDPVSQNIDIFAGGSAGVKLIEGGAGLGPSVAAASISLNGTGGMGINFYRDSKGDEFITRRFEAGVGVSLQSPSINAVVGDIQSGIEAGVMVKGIIGQTMYFPKSLDTKLAKEAKAAYILETFTMGGVELSPFASIFLRALEKSLLVANPDLNAIYSDLYYSNQVGSSVEGDASVGFSVALDKKNPQSKLDIVDYGGYIALTNKIYHNIQNNNKSFYFKYACGFDLSALKIKIANVGLGNLVENKYGNIFSIVANYVPQEGISSFDLSYEATSSAKITLSSYSTSYKYNFIIPKTVILNALNYSNDLIESVAGKLNPDLPKKPFKVGIKYFNKNLDELCAANPDTLNTLKDHIIFQKTKSSAKGLNVNVSVGLDAVIGEGAGLSLGINFSYLDKMNYPKSQYIVANSQVLPIAEYNDIPDNQRLFSIQKEIQDVFQGTKLLIKEPLNNLVHVVNQTVDKGKKFAVNMFQGTAKLTGKLMVNGLKWVARVSDPATKTIQKSTFLEPRIINAYSSHRIIHLNNKSASLAAEKAGSVLYIVSNNVNVSLLDSSNKVVDSFDPVTLSIAIDNKKVQELGFGQNEKHLAKMYRYDANKLVWVELSGDSNKDIDTVSTQITKSASYAVGIEINASDDTTAPDIVDYYPKNGEEISPVTNFWAKLYESPTGVGIDLSKTFLIIDSVKVDAVWNPVENIISFKSSDSLSPGQHTFEIVVKDYNGNTDSINSTVIVGNTTSINTHENIVSFNCYPVPMNNILNIEINSVSSKPISVSIYNQLGQLVSSIFECQPQNGHIKVQWDRTGKNYQRVRPGIYFVRVKQNNNIVVKKIILK